MSTEGGATMHRYVGIAVPLVALWAMPSGASTSPAKTVWVDCEGSPGGDGSWAAPYDSITAALPLAESLSASYRVTLDVADGLCDEEIFPIQLDFPVRLRGKRLPRYDTRGFPLPDQWRDTRIVCTQCPQPNVPPLALVRIAGPGVSLSRVSLEGGRTLAPDDTGLPHPTPLPDSRLIGVIVQGADGFVVEGVRVSGVGFGFRAEGSSGSLLGNHVGTAMVGMSLVGGDPAGPHTLFAWNNRLEYRLNGLVVAGGITANAATGTSEGRVVVAQVWRNDVTTPFVNTGPTNPTALRISPGVNGALYGDVTATFLGNVVGGAPKYSVMLHGGPGLLRSTGPFAGIMDLRFYGTEVESDSAVVLITFADPRAHVWPCELDPATPGGPLSNPNPLCPYLRPGLHLDYLDDSVFEVWHGGEFDDAWIDHPQFHPVDGQDLGNALWENGEPVPYETFVVVP